MKELKLRHCRLDERYDILDCLGRGSYSEIYSARDNAVDPNSPHRIVVVKALNVGLQGTADRDLERTLLDNFQNEAVALDRVRHPNIISRLGHGTAIDLDGELFHYLVLEYLSGGDLAAICKRAPLTVDQTLFYLEQVCSGLAYAHERGVIHRDIKPQNLLLTADGQTVKIADFGVAKLEAGEGAITRVGTNVYAPPEHSPLSVTGTLYGSDANVGHRLTPAADIYSLAKTAFTLLVGTSPRRFSHRQLTELPPELADQPWATAMLRVLARATYDEPARRYQTVQDFWDDFYDATLPVTEQLPEAAVSARESLSSQTLSEVRELAQAVPPQAKFDPPAPAVRPDERDFEVRPRIVVQVAEAKPAPIARTNGHADRRDAKEILRTMPDADADRAAREARAASTGRMRRFLLGLMLLGLFAAMLTATYSYFRGHGFLRRTQTAGTTGTAGSDDVVGREGTAVTDVNLRTGPAGNYPPVGRVESGSKIRVISVNGDWLEVSVEQHGRNKSDPNSSDRGWMIKTFQGKATVNFE